MKPLLLRFPGQRLAGALALLLMVLLALSTALSLSRTRSLDQQLSGFELGTLPTVHLLHGLGTGVEELRGMAALHLMLSGTAEMTALEAEMQDRRQQLGLRLAACASRLKGGADQQHYGAVQASMARFWVEQDLLAALSRQAAADPVAAAAARNRLVGPALQAFLQLGAEIEAWWLELENEANQQARQAHADAASTAGQLLALVALALLAAVSSMGRLHAAGIAAIRSDSVPAAALTTAGSTAGSPAAVALAAIAQAQLQGQSQRQTAGQMQGPINAPPDAPPDASPDASPDAPAQTPATGQPITQTDRGPRARWNKDGADQ